MRSLQWFVILMLSAAACGSGTTTTITPAERAGLSSSTVRTTSTTTEEPEQIEPGADAERATTTTSTTTPPGLADPEPADRLASVETFLDLLEAGDIEAATDMWSGYPLFFGESDAVDKMAVVSDWAEANAWLFVPNAEFVRYENPAFGFTPEWTATTVTIADLVNRQSVSFLVDVDGTLVHIRSQVDVSKVDGAVLVPGGVLRLDARPIEGGVVAYLDGEPIEDVEVALDGSYTEITLPDEVPRIAVLTVSFATPEYPTVDSFVLAWSCGC